MPRFSGTEGIWPLVHCHAAYRAPHWFMERPTGCGTEDRVEGEKIIAGGGGLSMCVHACDLAPFLPPHSHGAWDRTASDLSRGHPAWGEGVAAPATARAPGGHGGHVPLDLPRGRWAAAVGWDQG